MAACQIRSDHTHGLRPLCAAGGGAARAELGDPCDRSGAGCAQESGPLHPQPACAAASVSLAQCRLSYRSTSAADLAPDVFRTPADTAWQNAVLQEENEQLRDFNAMLQQTMISNN